MREMNRVIRSASDEAVYRAGTAYEAVNAIAKLLAAASRRRSSPSNERPSFSRILEV